MPVAQHAAPRRSPAPSGTPYDRATIAPVSSTHPTPSPMPSAAVSTSMCARGCRGRRRTRAGRAGTAAASPSAATVISAAGIRSSANATSATSTTASPTRNARAGPWRQMREQRTGQRRLQQVLARRGAVSRGCAASPGPSRAAGSGGSRTARSTRLRERRSGRSGIPSVGDVLVVRCSSRRLLQDEQVAHQVVDVGCAEAGDQVVAGARVVDGVAAERDVAERRAAARPRRCGTAAG